MDFQRETQPKYKLKLYTDSLHYILEHYVILNLFGSSFPWKTVPHRFNYFSEKRQAWILKEKLNQNKNWSYALIPWIKTLNAIWFWFDLVRRLFEKQCLTDSTIFLDQEGMKFKRETQPKYKLELYTDSLH